MLRPCLSTWGLCCFALQLDQAPSHSLNSPPPPPSPVCPSGLTFAVNCLCFLSFFHTPPTFSLQHLCFCAPLLLYRHPLLPPPLCHLCLSPLITWALAVARQKRSGLMVSEDFRALLISTGYSLVLLLA